MASPRRSSSVYSRDSEGDEYAISRTHEASRTALQATLFRPFSHSMGSSPKEAHQEDRSWGKVNGLISACHLLVWADGFQFHIMHAVKLMQDEIRPLFREWPTPQRVETLEVKCQDLSTVLASWTRHNQLLSRGVSPAALEALPDLSTVDVGNLSQAAAEYQQKLHCLPTSKACEANLDIIYRLRAYFVEDVEFFSTSSATDNASLRTVLERKIRNTASAVHKYLDDVLFSAEQVLDDATTAWHNFARMSDKIAEAAAASIKQAEDEEKTTGSPGRRLRALGHVKSLFSTMRIYHNTVRMEDGHLRPRKKSFSKSDGARIISGPSEARHVQGLSGPGTRSLLVVLAHAPLSDLVQRQLEIYRHFARFELLRLPGEYVEPSESQKSVLRLDDDTSLEQRRSPCVGRFSLDDEYQHLGHKGSPKTSRHRSTSSMNVESRHHGIARSRSNHSPPMAAGRDETVSNSLEQEIIEACAGGAALDQPSNEEDPEDMKAWWRNRAMQALEGGPLEEEKPESNECGAQAEEAEEDTEEETEEEAKSRRERDTAKALALLEGHESGEDEFPSQEEWLEQQCGMNHWTLD